MPVRSLNSSVLKWPDAPVVILAFRTWAQDLLKKEKEVVKIGYFGSYARGNWGVGSDLDVIAIVHDAQGPREKRGLTWDTSSIPVPVDLQILSETEYNSLPTSSRFKKVLDQEVVWIV
jgi:predicted nucleotidyltransferase